MRGAERRGFWVSFVGFFVFFSYLVAFGSKLWSLSLPLQLTGIILGLIILFGWLAWRGVKHPPRLPVTGLEWIFIFGVVIIALSLVYSPDPSQGTLRAGWLVGYIIIFYLMVDILDAGINRWGALAAFLATSGVLLLLGVFETYLWYSQWWQMVGQVGLLPPEPYRFKSLLTNGSPLIAVANMGVLFSFLLILKVKKPIVRVLCGYWLLIYILAFPFSSSRGGWLGLAVTVFAAVGLFFYEKRLWRKVQGWSQHKKAIGVLAAFIGILFLAISVYFFMVTFGSHSSRGGNAFGLTGRDAIWQNSFDIWKSFPILGAGPGRFSVEYRLTEGGSSPAWWAPHAHNTSLQFLAEFGILGLIAWLAVVMTGFLWVWRNYRSSSPNLKLWNAIALAGLMGLLAHLIFDEYSTWPTVMVAAVFLGAWVGTGNSTHLVRSQRLSLMWVWLPAIALTIWAAWGIYTFEPMTRWAAAALGTGGYRASAELIHQSVLRDPKNSLYTASEALAWAASWGETQEKVDLEQAQFALQKSLTQEPGYANLWANLATLEWYSGDSSSALDHIDKAIRMAPREYSFLLNRAWFKEQNGDINGATADYLQALTLAPDHANHPFWQGTSTRQQVFQRWNQSHSAPSVALTYWQQALTEVQRGDLEPAQLNLARSWAVDESPVARIVVQGQLYERAGRLDDSVKEYAKLVDVYTRGLFLDFGRTYIGTAVVPGFFHLEPDVGQFEALERLVNAYRTHGECDQAIEVWATLQREKSGGAFEKISKPLVCP